jgi:hypothetical protein
MWMLSLQRVRDKGGPEALRSASIVDIAPKLTKDGIIVKIDDQDANVPEINEVKKSCWS